MISFSSLLNLTIHMELLASNCWQDEVHYDNNYGQRQILLCNNKPHD